MPSIQPSHERTLVSLLAGASVAMIGVTTAILFYSIQGVGNFSQAADDLVVRLLAVSSTATILVMSTLHGQLRNLYSMLASNNELAMEDARRDSLTGVGNRKLLLEELKSRQSMRSKEKRHALFFLDLDQFKRVNDTLGHHVGDGLIRAVADRLATLGSEVVVTRLGGDEFALVADVGKERNIVTFGNDIVRLLAGMYQIGDTNLSVGVSIGATYLKDAIDASTAMRQADIAMYAAKADGGGFRAFDKRMSVQIDRRALIEQRLVELVKRNGNKGDSKATLSAVFQPVVDIDGKLVAAEALLRFTDDDIGSVSPEEVVAVAEQAHLIGDVGQIMARAALCAARTIGDASVCLNVSPIELLDPSYAKNLESMARALKVAPERVQIEISERSLLERGGAVAETLAELRETGFVLSVDDFGSSVASVNHLSDHAVSIVKIDARLVRNAKKARSVAVLSSLVKLVKSHDIAVVCEGVADSEDEAIALATGCSFLQGFHFSKPMEIGALVEAYVKPRLAPGMRSAA
ncbi:EAL domain-containing protein [Altererythrobacter arenosus]|uniref:EAL domain-containing protein n=1 Tax=Altererythrobacter arenosus TaxID=3032592 RepID=A0ABY8FQI0_9SPHN|nr:EAL domain-containing protein [Altererythrobacter sp. CAU 1644]WFL76158.1 EAL domain-containing protein [Altererythrobacter sp. CAU 1644]